MKSFDERREEIFRRSNDIKVRKNRRIRQVFSTLYIIVLIIAIGTTKIASQSNNYFQHPSANETESTEDFESPSSTLMFDDNIEISINTSDGLLKNSIDGELLKSEIDTIFNNAEENAEIILPEHETASDLDSPDDEADSVGSDELTVLSYSISITERDGTVKAYTLKGNVLYCESEKRTIILTEEQQERLLSVILNAD